MRPEIITEKCVGCGKCASVCPVDPKVMEFKDTDTGRKAFIKHPEVCDLGAACVRACPTGAFQLVDG